MAKRVAAMDRISDLPDPILHHMLSFLPIRDAFQTSVLSKRWKSLLPTFPFLHFNLRDFGKFLLSELERDDLGESNPQYIETIFKFVDCVDECMARFSSDEFSLQRFKLFIQLPDMFFADSLDNWVRLAIENGVKEMDLSVPTPDFFPHRRDLYTVPEMIFASNSITYLKLFNCCVKLEESFCGKLHSLKRLQLRQVVIPDHVVRKLVACCPLIEDLSLISCYGLNKVQVSGLFRLKKFELLSDDMDAGQSVEIASPSLECSHLSVRDGSVNVDACQGLKSLHISESVITKQFFENLDSKFPNLEVLTITDCWAEERVKISSWGLKHLGVSSCHNSLDIEIDTPNLLSCSYSTSVIPAAVLSINAPLCHWKVEFDLKGSINIHWYMLLKEFLAKLNKLVYLLHIHIRATTEISFNLEDLSKSSNACPSVIEDVLLTVQPECPVSNCSALIDGLFWCYRPENLFVRSGEDQNKYVEYLSEFLDRRDVSCCNHGNVKCWRHDLKEVKVESFEEKADRKFPHTHYKMKWQF